MRVINHFYVTQSSQLSLSNTSEVFDVRGKQGMNVRKRYYALRSRHTHRLGTLVNIGVCCILKGSYDAIFKDHYFVCVTGYVDIL